MESTMERVENFLKEIFKTPQNVITSGNMRL